MPAPKSRRHPALPSLVAGFLVFSWSCGTQLVPVTQGVEALQKQADPGCESIVATGGSMGIAQHAQVSVTSCGTTVSYVCSTDALPAADFVAHARAQCAPSDSLRGAAIQAATRQRDEDERRRLTRPMTVGDSSTQPLGPGLVRVRPRLGAGR